MDVDTINELHKRKLKKLIDDLSRITGDMRSLEGKLNNSRNFLRETVLIDKRIYEEDKIIEIENEAKDILNDIQHRIIPNLIREVNS